MSDPSPPADAPPRDTPEPRLPPRIVGIGASAGGLAPCEEFFKAASVRSGCAFVVIQHLSPDFRSLMDELLARQTALPILHAEDGMPIQSDVIYLNAPRAILTVADGRFKLDKIDSDGASGMPINAFFTSLAREAGPRSIAVILSGSGTDGARGCEAVKAAGGLVLVQDPNTAKFDSMPASIVRKGLADVVAEPRQLPDAIIRRMKESTGAASAKGQTSAPLDKIYDRMRDRFGAEFGFYKAEAVERRLDRRRELAGASDLASYHAMLESDPSELDRLYNDLLIEVTAFFRDREAFDTIEAEVVPKIGAKMAAGETVRIWTPGCASGEEAYSLAILFSEFARAHDMPLDLKIMATDIHNRSLDAASAGVYPAEALRDMPVDLLERYFEPIGNFFQVRPHLRRTIVFSPHNLLRDPPFTRMDLVSCRNVLIYFRDIAQQKCLALFHFALNKDGFLFLGPSETIGALQAEFKTVDRRWRIFSKLREARLAVATHVLPHALDHLGPRDRDRRQDMPRGLPSRDGRGVAQAAIGQAMQILLNRYAPAGFLVGRDGDLVHVFGDAGRYLTIAEGGFSRRVWDLVHPDLRPTVGAGVDRVRSGVITPFSRHATLTREDGTVEPVEISIEGMAGPGEHPEYVLLRIEPVNAPAPKKKPDRDTPDLGADDASYLQERITDLEGDLRSTEESLQTTIEELEASNEELQATNEEMMASNEELQSTNEELNSVNEELFSVSSEHQLKIEELTELTDDMDHLLKSTGIGTIFLDVGLNIRRFTPAASLTFNLIPEDVGRPISHVTYRFKSLDLIEIISDVMTTLAEAEREVRVDGSRYLLRVLPYVKTNDVAAGIVITTINVDALRHDPSSQGPAQGEATAPDDLEFTLRWSARTGQIVYCDTAFAALARQPVNAVIGSSADRLFPDAIRAAAFAALETLAPGGAANLRLPVPERPGFERALTVRAMADGGEGVAAFHASGREAPADTLFAEAAARIAAHAVAEPSAADDALKALLRDALEYLCLDHAIAAHQPEEDATPRLAAAVSFGEPEDPQAADLAAPIGLARLRDLARLRGKDASDPPSRRRMTLVSPRRGGVVVCLFNTSQPRATAFTASETRYAEIAAALAARMLPDQPNAEAT